MLKIEHLVKRYGDKVAVDDLSLHIKRGEIYGKRQTPFFTLQSTGALTGIS